MDIINTLTFEALSNYHKQEGQEELAYLAILFTIIIGIIGFLGSTKKIEKSARILILLFYVCFHFSIMSATIGSLKIHSAIHEEIALYVNANPQIFINGEDSPLYTELKDMHGHDIKMMVISGYLLLAFMVLCILSLGPDEILKWKWIENFFRRKKS